MYTVLIQQVLNALQLGAIYALIALGYSMVYGIIRLINFAHGDIFMVGAYIGLGVAVFLKPPVLVLMLVTMGLTALIGVTIERVAYRRLRYAQRMSAVITALGVGIFLENFVRAAISANPQAYPTLIQPRPITLSGISTSNIQLFVIGLSIGLMLILRYVIRQTMLGKAMRAVSDNKEVIPLMGINLNLVVAATFAIGSALAAAGGIFYGQAYPMIDPYMGIVIGWKAFISAVMGGIGQIDGAMLGGFILGAVEVIGAAYRSTLRDGIAFAILIIVLLVKPTGLLGRPVSKKV